jgi:AcrR family transcriptional regulator
MAKSSTESNSSSEKASLTPADWEQAALALIAEKGIAALRVEPLARRLGITKGSFYWHFPGRDELLSRALERWEQQDSQHLKLSLRAATEPTERLTDFVWRTSRQTLTHRIYVALCASPDDPRIGPVLRRVTERRLKYLASALEELGLDAIKARHRANLMYSSYVGYLQLQAQGLVPDKDESAFDEYVGHVIETLIEV